MDELKSHEIIRYEKIAKRIRRRRLSLIIGVIGLLLLVWVLSSSLFQRAVVSGDCMEPAIHNKEEYILNRWSYKISNPKRNDIIVYESDGIYYMSRIIGLPGETVQMKDGKIYINETLLTGQREYPEEENILQMLLKKKEYLILADNPEGTSIGKQRIKKNEITGKVWITH